MCGFGSQPIMQEFPQALDNITGEEQELLDIIYGFVVPDSHSRPAGGVTEV